MEDKSQFSLKVLVPRIVQGDGIKRG